MNNVKVEKLVEKKKKRAHVILCNIVIITTTNKNLGIICLGFCMYEIEKNN